MPDYSVLTGKSAIYEFISHLIVLKTTDGFNTAPFYSEAMRLVIDKIKNMPEKFVNILNLNINILETSLGKVDKLKDKKECGDALVQMSENIVALITGASANSISFARNEKKVVIGRYFLCLFMAGFLYSNETAMQKIKAGFDMPKGSNTREWLDYFYEKSVKFMEKQPDGHRRYSHFVTFIDNCKKGEYAKNGALVTPMPQLVASTSVPIASTPVYVPAPVYVPVPVYVPQPQPPAAVTTTPPPGRQARPGPLERVQMQVMDNMENQMRLLGELNKAHSSPQRPGSDDSVVRTTTTPDGNNSRGAALFKKRSNTELSGATVPGAEASPTAAKPPIPDRLPNQSPGPNGKPKTNMFRSPTAAAKNTETPDSTILMSQH